MHWMLLLSLAISFTPTIQREALSLIFQPLKSTPTSCLEVELNVQLFNIRLYEPAWNPPPPRKMGERGDNFIGPCGTLNFYLPLGGLSQMRGLKSFTLFGGDNKVFSSGGNAGSPFPTGQKSTHPSPTRESPPSRLNSKFLFPLTKVHPPTK